MQSTQTTCTVAGCERVIRARQLCETHYCRWKRLGTTELPPKRPTTCIVEGCDRPRHVIAGYCDPHYYRVKKYGDPLATPIKETVGDNIANSAAHSRVTRLWGGPAKNFPCVDCGGPADHWSYDHTDPDEKTSDEGPYSVDPSHYAPRCVRCHRKFDRGTMCGRGLHDLTIPGAYYVAPGSGTRYCAECKRYYQRRTDSRRRGKR